MPTGPVVTRPLRWPIRWRLPLLICILLLVSLTAFGWAAHREVQKALLEIAQTRLQTVSRQLQGLLTQSLQQRTDEARRLAARPSVQALVAAPNDAVVRAQLHDELAVFLKTSPQTLGVEVWGPSGARLLDLAQTESAAAKDGTPPPRTSAPTAKGFTPLMPFHDGAYYEVTAPIASTGASTGATGYLLVRRQSTTPGASGMLGALMGNGTSIQFGSKDGLWTDLSKVVPAPPAARANEIAEYTAPNGEERLGIAASVRDTPWTLWVGIPRATALAPVQVFLRRVIPIGLAVLLFGPVIAWVAGWRMTRPLNELTVAAESIARGDLTQRVHVGHHDEIGRLGVAFNTMVERVEAEHQLLEGRVAERTATLEEALVTLRSTQEELVRREKLAMLGQLASGVGHELRNPLGVMTNAVYFLEMVQPDAPAVVKEYYGVLRSQIGLSEKIVSDLLDFARIKPPRREPVPLARLVDDQLARVPTAENVRIVREVPANLPLLNVDPVQIGQVVLNLLVNAVQAMEAKGGVLTVRGSLDAGRIRLDVTDTGPGVPPELQDKIFEALFTTKPRGIGLGLAVSRSLTEANDGILSVTSRAGEGATFSLTVPAVQVLEPVS
jgi:signal transduction histidine kinase